MHITVKDINAGLACDAAGLVAAAQGAFERRLDDIAAYIVARRDVSPIILLAGPSGSGKTTTARLLEAKLDALGCETHTLSMDDYFHSLTDEQRSLAATERFDLESPERVDAALLGDQLRRFIAGEPIDAPVFDFSVSRRAAQTRTLVRKPNELLILEGIHALNPAVVTLPETQTVRLYVSVRTRLVTADGAPLHPANIRLMRRILRDVKFRSRDPRDTLRMFRSVQAGEEKYIAPYKPRSSFDIDTFFPYEVSVYQPMLLPLVAPLADHPEIAAMLPALREISPLCPAAVPADALIREFIG